MPQQAANPTFMVSWKCAQEHPHTSSLHLSALPHHLPLLPTLGALTLCPSKHPAVMFWSVLNTWQTQPFGLGQMTLGGVGRGADLAPGCKFAMGDKTPSWVKTMSFGASWES